MLICRTKLSDVYSAEKVFETELATIKANNYVKKGDEILAN